MLTTKTSIIAEEEDKVGKDLNPVSHEEIEEETLSCYGTDFERKQSISTLQGVTKHRSFNDLIEQQEKLTQTVEKLSSDMTVFKKMMNDDMKTLKFDLENCLKTKKDTIKSYLSMKKDVSALQGQFHMVYGKKFFDHKK